MIVLRRRLKDAVGLSLGDDGGAPQLAFVEIGEAAEVHEYSILVTSLDEDGDAFGQLYRDRGDAENIFDEMKNQWGWGGYTTHDLARCRLAARLIALFYNWWNIFVRLADPSLHREAITSRPLFLTAIATRTRHARQTTIRVTSSHAMAKPAAQALAAVAAFLRGLAKNAEQFTRRETWRAILSRAFQAFPQRPPPARPASPRAQLMQPKREKPQTAQTSHRPTAGFRNLKTAVEVLQGGGTGAFSRA